MSDVASTSIGITTKRSSDKDEEYSSSPTVALNQHNNQATPQATQHITSGTPKESTAAVVIRPTTPRNDSAQDHITTATRNHSPHHQGADNTKASSSFSCASASEQSAAVASSIRSSSQSQQSFANTTQNTNTTHINATPPPALNTHTPQNSISSLALSAPPSAAPKGFCLSEPGTSGASAPSYYVAASDTTAQAPDDLHLRSSPGESLCHSSHTQSMPLGHDNDGARAIGNTSQQLHQGDEVATSSIVVDSDGAILVMLTDGPEIVDFQGAKGLVKRAAINAALIAGLSRDDYPVAAIWGPRGSGKTVAARMYAEQWQRSGGKCVVLNGSSGAALQQWMDAQQAFFEENPDEIRLLCVVEDVTEASSFINFIEQRRQRLLPLSCAVLFTTSEEAVAMALTRGAPEAPADASVLTQDEAVLVLTSLIPELRTSTAITAPPMNDEGVIAACLLTYCHNRADLVHQCACTYAANVNRPQEEAFCLTLFYVTRFLSWIEEEWRWMALLRVARHARGQFLQRLSLFKRNEEATEEGACAVDDEQPRRNKEQMGEAVIDERQAALKRQLQSMSLDSKISKSRSNNTFTSSSSMVVQRPPIAAAIVSEQDWAPIWGPKKCSFDEATAYALDDGRLRRRTAPKFDSKSYKEVTMSEPSTVIVQRPQIADAVVRGHSRQDWPVAAIWGPSGCGKSTAARLAASTWDGSTLTLDGSSEEALQVALLNLLPTEDESQLRKAKTTTTQIVQSAVRSLPIPFLFILENVDDLEFGTRIVRLLVDLIGPTMIIVTTHKRDVALDVARSEEAVVDASKLTMDEVVELFLSTVGCRVDVSKKSKLQTLLETNCGNSAWLVHRCAISYGLFPVSSARADVAELAVDHVESWLEGEWRQVAAADTVRTARRVFDLTIEQAKAVWPIEASVFELSFRCVAQLLQSAKGHVDVSRELFAQIVTILCSADADTMHVHIELVLRLGRHIGLIKRMQEGALTFHRLDIEGALMPSEALRQLSLLGYCEWTKRALENARDLKELRLLRHVTPPTTSAGRTEAIANELRGSVLLKLGEAAAALKALQRSLAHWTKENNIGGEGDGAQKEEAHFVKLAQTFLRFGEAVAALKARELSLAPSTKEPSGVHKARVRNKVGAALRALGQTEKALVHYVLALWIEKVEFGERHVQVARTLNNTGTALSDLGETDSALAYYEQALSILEQHFDNDNVEVASTLNNIGTALRALGKTEKALEHHGKALQIIEKCLGEQHVDVAKTRNSIGNALRHLGKPALALAHYKQALSIMKAHFGDHHVQLTMTLNNIGIALRHLGEPALALAHYEQALSIEMVHFGEHHIQVAMTLNNIGAAYSDLGHTEKALEHYEQALSIMKTQLGKHHVHVASILNNIVGVFTSTGGADPHVVLRYCRLFAEAYRYCVSHQAHHVTRLLDLVASLMEVFAAVQMALDTLQRIRSDCSLGASMSANLYISSPSSPFPPGSLCVDLPKSPAFGSCTVTLAFTAFYPMVPPYIHVVSDSSCTEAFVGYPHPAINATGGLVHPWLVNILWFHASLFPGGPTYDLQHAKRVVEVLLLTDPRQFTHESLRLNYSWKPEQLSNTKQGGVVRKR